VLSIVASHNEAIIVSNPTKPICIERADFGNKLWSQITSKR